MSELASRMHAGSSNLALSLRSCGTTSEPRGVRVEREAAAHVLLRRRPAPREEPEKQLGEYDMNQNAKHRAWWMVGIVALGSGCSFESSEGEAVAPDADASSAAAPSITPGDHQRILARVELSPQTAVTFIATEIDGELHGLDVVEQFPLTAAPPLAALSLANATLLDAFRAVSDAEPPAELVRDHLDTGRQLDDVRPASLNGTRLLSFSTSGCTSYILDLYPNNQLVLNNQNTLPNGTAWAISPGDNVQWPSNSLVYERYTAGTCADSAAATISSTYRSRRIGTTSWTTVQGPSAYVAIGNAWKLTGGPAQGFERQPSIKTLGSDHHVRGGVGSFAQVP